MVLTTKEASSIIVLGIVISVLAISSTVPTAEMLANCFTKPLPKPAILKQCATMGMIGIGLGNGLGIGMGSHLGNVLGTLRTGCRNGIVIVNGNGIRNTV